VTKLVAVSLSPREGRVRETEFHKADSFHFSKSGENLYVEKGGEIVAQYPRGSVQSVRFSNRVLRTAKVKFVRVFVRAKHPLAGLLSQS
jgi:hypothetical protein